jgi:hypothetical protein
MPLKAEVSEETEVTEVNSETISKSLMEAKTSLDRFKAVYWSVGFYRWHDYAV